MHENRRAACDTGKRVPPERAMLFHESVLDLWRAVLHLEELGFLLKDFPREGISPFRGEIRQRRLMGPRRQRWRTEVVGLLRSDGAGPVDRRGGAESVQQHHRRGTAARSSVADPGGTATGEVHETARRRRTWF